MQIYISSRGKIIERSFDYFLYALQLILLVWLMTWFNLVLFAKSSIAIIIVHVYTWWFEQTPSVMF